MTPPPRDLHPLSYGQRALWFLQRLAPGSAAYNVPFAGRVHAAVDGEALRQGFQALADRHPALRTTYPLLPEGEGAPLQQIHQPLEIDFAEIDAAAWDEEELHREVTAEAHRPIALDRPPVVRVRLFRHKPDDCVLLLLLHHIAVDFQSLSVILTDLQELLAASFAGRPAELPPPRGSYADFARWQAAMLQGPEGERSWEYWRNELAGELPQLALPTDRPRPRVQSFRGGVVGFDLEEATCAGLARLGESAGTSLFTVVVASFKALLHRVSGQDEIVVGSTLPGRPGPELRDVVGYFVNTVLLRGDLAGDPPFRRLLAREARVVSGALAHQHLPFPLLVERLAPERDLGRSPLYQVLLAFYESGAEEQVLRLLTGEGEHIRLGPLDLEPFAIDRGTSMLDLTLNVMALPDRMGFSLQYDADLFDPATAEGLARGLQALLEQVVRHPDARLSELLLGGPSEHAQLTAESPGRPVSPPRQPAPEPATDEEADDLQGIAIVGLAVRFPGAADAEQFWENLRAGVEAITFFDREELRAAGTDPALLDHPNFVRAAGRIEGIELFDAGFFNYNAREASIIDPQQRIFLECAWEALEDAACDPETFNGPIGVYAGVSASTYLYHLLARRQAGDPVDLLLDLVGNDKDFIATRASYKLGLTGPSFTVQSACSTSLVATHLACQSLLNGECDVALAGGASIATPQERGYLYSPAGIMSPDGHCRAFDARARGTVGGSGAGVVVLKRLEDALADGDRIRAVIRGSAVNNDGPHKAGFTAPSAEGQGRVIAEALAVAGVPARSISYIETHGSGTPLGDTIEVAALSRVFAAVTEPRSCALGSVKTNLGHLDAAAGVAGLIKTALALQHRALPASLNFEEPSPRLHLDEGPFYVNTRLSPWPAGRGPRRAGVSAFGLGGTNAHLVLQEPPAAEASTPSRPWQLLLLSARTPAALERATDRMSAHLAAHPEQDFADVAYTAKLGRRAFKHRRMLVCHDGADASAALAGRDPSRLLGGAEEMADRPVAFAFPGLGEHYPEMGRGLYEQEPGFRERMDRCAELLLPLLGADLRELLYPARSQRQRGTPASGGVDLRAMLGRSGDGNGEGGLDSRLDRTAFAHPALFAVEYALAGLWQDWGIVPQAVVGYSLGEYVAACVAGVFSLEDALLLVARRAQMIEELPAGAMLAVPLAGEALRGLLGPDLGIAAVNGPQISVVAGHTEVVAELESRLAVQGIACRRLRTRHAFHCGLMAPIAERFTRLVAEVPRREPSIPLLSNVTGTWLRPEEAADPGYWARHLLGTVRFADNLAELWNEPGRILLEVGPGQSLASLALQHPASAVAGSAGPLALHSLAAAYERQDDQEVLLAALGRLWLAGVRVDWRQFYAGERRLHAALPTYPFERQRYWFDGLAEAPVAQSIAAQTTAAPETRATAAAPTPTPTSSTTSVHTRPNLANVYVAPETDLERSIARLWQELLGVEQVGVHDSFFALGGHSLLATQVISRLVDALGIELSLEQIFEAPTVAELAGVIAAMDGFTATAAAPPRPPIPPRPDPERAPLSFAQQRLWFIDQLAPGNPLYNVAVALRIEGPLDVRVLTLCLGEIVRRHETLRTVFALQEGAPVQVIRPAVPFALPVVDISAVPESGREALTDTLIGDEAGRPFDLASAPQLRATLLRLAKGDHIVALTLHHIVCDSWSISILVREVTALYAAFAEGRPSPLPELPVQYADYAVWQGSWLRGETLETEVAFWREQLAGLPPLLTLPSDRPRPAVLSFRGSTRPVRLSAGLLRQAEALGRREGATLFMVLLAAFQALLARSSGQQDLAVGAPVAGRNRVEIEGLIGFFINTLVLRGDLTGADGGLSFRELLGRARETALTAYKHQDVPFEKLVQELTPERRLDHTPLFQVMLVLQNAPAEDLEIEDLRLRMMTRVTTTSKFDLTLNIGEYNGDLAGEIEYSTDLFDAVTVDRLMGHFERLLASALAEPGSRLLELELLSSAERHQLLREWNDTAVPRQDGVLLQDLFAAAVARAPHAPAVTAEDRTLTYGEIDRITGRLARRLRGLGVGPDVAVGVLMERSAEMVVALLGILRAGGAYLPLDPESPGERLAGMAAEAGVPVLLTQERLLAVLPPIETRVLLLEERWDGSEEDDEGAALPGISDASLAYLLYTSGSTGRPKGVMIPHRGIVNRLLWMQEAYGLTPDDRVLQKTPFGFDVSVWEFFWPLITGACLVVARPGGHRDAAYLAGLIARERITVTHFVPSMLQIFLDQPALPACPSLRLVIASGEALSPELRRRFQERVPARLENLYGPTEASVDVTAWNCAEVTRESVVPIGRPVANTAIHLLDRAFRPIPIGLAGELCIGGVQLARGYWKRPDLTAERFMPDSCGGSAGGRLYRTGDLARHLPDGSIEFLGRLDHQVKVRGFRIELGEIEAALASHPGVRHAVVSLRADQLIAHFVPVSGATGAAELRAHLRRSLPEYMVPSAFVSLPELPLTVSGKVNRLALPEPPRARDAAPLLLPRSPVENAIAGIWAEILQVDRVGVQDNFFDVGGHSLRVVEVQAGIRRVLGREVPIVELFRHPTIASLAAFLGGAPREALPEAGERREAGGDIAIIALEGRFPGAPDVERFWDNLREGVESIARLTDEQLLAAGVDPRDLERPDLVRAEALLEGIDLFDASFFGFNPREAQALDPQQRLFLEHAWACLERAGYDPARYAGRIGVFAGSGMGTYALNVFSDPEMCEALDPLSLRLGIDKDFLATRVAYKLGLRGPAVSVQTACSTSLVAVHFARQSLLAGECDMAMAGGVTLNVRQGTGYRHVQGGIGSPDGHCRAFDAAAQGTVPGSGIGLVLLKRLEDALRDGDTIHAVLKGSAINNDGALKVGYTAPSVDGQAKAISAALAAAGVSADSITYVEAHGTATSLGDPIEVAALTQAFRQGTGRTGFCSLGSVKTNFGHLDTAAGVAGLIKTALALEHRQIPPSLHFESPNPALDLAASPFRVADRLTDWPVDGTPRRAGVSSFGIGGTNAHAVLEEAPPVEPSGASRPFQLLLLSARTSGALEEATARLALWLESHPDVPLADVAHTLRVGRHPFDHRRMLVCASREGALAALHGEDPERLLTGRRENDPPAVAWLLPGQGSQHPGMGRDLYESEPVFRREIDLCAEILTPRTGRDLREILFWSPGAEIAETRFAQPALFAVEHALARLWLSWGLRPQALIGHSLGEYVAACLAGVLSLDDALTLVAARGELMQGLPPGAMLSVDLSADEALAEIAAAPGLSLAAVNGPGQCVISGPAREIDALAGRLTQRSVPCRRLHTSHAFHSDMMEPILDRFAEIVARVELRPPSLPYLSNLTGDWITASEATDPRYWVRHLRETVRFGEGVARLLAELPERAVLLEVGPGRALSRLVRSQAAGRTVLASMPPPDSSESGAAALLHAAGRLWLTGVEIDWQLFQGDERRRRVPLPTYPFQRRRFWVDAPHQGLAAGRATADPRRVLVLGEGEPARATADLSGLLRDPRNAEVLKALLEAEPDLRVLLPLAPEERTSPEHGTAAALDEPIAGNRRPDLPTPYLEPQSEPERRLAAIWGDLLGIDRVGIHDDFFELGGHSLLATRLLSRVREDFGCEIAMEALFEAPTVARLAAYLPVSGEPPASQTAPILPVPRAGDLPLSYAQQRLLFLAVMEPGDPSYNLPIVLRLAGSLDVRGLRLALDALLARHEPLRTTFRIRESQVDQVIAPAAGLPLPLADLAGLPADLREEEGRRLAIEQARQSFDLLRGPVVASLLVRLTSAEHLLLLTVHHIAADGWSCAVLYRDLTELYHASVEGRPPLLPALPVQYADFAAWQRTRTEEERLEQHLDYWRNHLAGARPAALPTDHARPLRPSGRGATLLFAFPAATVEAARRLARGEDSTLFMVLLSAFAALLYRATGSDDLVIGTDIANRNRRETEDLIGLFVNQLVLRNDLSGNPTFRELVRRSRRITLKAYTHQDAPFDRLVEALNPVRDLGTTPLFQAKLVLQNAQMPVHQLQELQVAPLEIHNQTAKFDLLLNLAEIGDTVSGVLEYSVDLWEEASMARLLADFTTVLATGVSQPDERLSRIVEELSRIGAQPAEERRTIRRRRAIPVSLE